MGQSMDQDQIALLQRTLNQFDPQRFYELLFQRHPEVRDLFPSDGQLMAAQHARLAAAVAGVVSRLGAADGERVLSLGLQALGRRHAAFYAVRPEHYPLVGLVLLESFAPVLTPAEHVAWGTAYAMIAHAMQEGAKAGPPPGSETLL